MVLGSGVQEAQVYHSRMRLMLASASPRRTELLREAGYVFEVEPADVDESELAGEPPAAYVVRVAAMKARAIAARHPDEAILAADTTVVIDGEILAKPADDADAARMLGLLSGRDARRADGRRAGPGRTGVVRGCRHAGSIPAPHRAEIDWYVASGEPRDKAGAYGVQGLAARFVESVDGSYSNVVGLPVGAVRALLEAEGLAPHDAGRAERWTEPAPFDRTGG